MKHFIFLLTITIVLAGCSSQSVILDTLATPQYPFPQHVSYAPNTIKPNKYSQTQQDQDVKTYYTIWKSRYVVNTGQTVSSIQLYRIALGNPGTPKWNQTVSEGQGYGMMIVALMAGHDTNAQTIFDGLWKFSRVNFSRVDKRLMRWKVPTVLSDQDSAFDGDADIAYALLLAHQQWGSTGQVNYLQEAKTVIQAIRESTIGKNSYLPLLGDWARDEPDTALHNQYSPRSSDFMPAHFRAFGRATNQALFWNQVVSKTQGVTTIIQQNYSSATGLLPDFIVNTCTNTAFCPPQGETLEEPTDKDYSFNAGRVPMRLGTDVLINNSSSRAQVRKISLWARRSTGGDPLSLKEGYHLDGSPINVTSKFNIFFAAPFGVAAMSVPSQQVWLNSIYDSVRIKHQGYYEDSVALLCLLIMTGNYWDPTTIQ